MLSIRESCQAMWDWMVQYAGDFPVLLFLSLASVLYLLIACPSFRQKLLLPIIVLVIVVVNPVLYSLVYGNNNLPFVASYGLRYWRFFWLLPQGILIAIAAIDLIRRFSNPLFRCLGLAVATALIMLVGQNLYTKEKEFIPVTSAYRMKPLVEEASRIIMADNPHPICLFDGGLSAHIRLYSGDIRQVWGRSGTWSVIPDAEAAEAYRQLREKPRNWAYVFDFAEQRGVTHIGYTRKDSEDQDELLAMAQQHGYTVLHTIGRTIIFHRTS